VTKKKFYITTPIYYVNAAPHIGHAYTQVAVDVLARYHRLLGEDVFFLTGTDEHGEKISEASLAAGGEKGSEKKFVDAIVGNFKKVWKELDIQYDCFIRTTDEKHKETVQRFLNKALEAGDIYQGEYDGWFCTPCETFWTKTQAAEGTCPDCRRPVEQIKEKNYFFRMSKYQKWLIGYINENPEFIMPAYRKNEVLGFLREDLDDLCISRPKERMAWGIELPFDKKYVVYVWFDALINYVSGLEVRGKFKEFWPANFHIIAKDILRHHAVYWPIMLKSAELPQPDTIFAHGWWKMGKEKMSKSRGNIVDPVVLAEKYGRDALRYFLMKAVVFGMDGVFSEDAFVVMYNSDLANDLGNLLNRTLTMVDKYFEGVSPETNADPSDERQTERSRQLRDAVRALSPKVRDCLISRKLLLKEALEEIMRVVGFANKYIEESAPWKYKKENNMNAIKVIIADLLETLRTVAVNIDPFMPATARKMWRQLGLEENADGGMKESAREKEFPAGTKVAKGSPLFPRLI